MRIDFETGTRKKVIEFRIVTEPVWRGRSNSWGSGCGYGWGLCDGWGTGDGDGYGSGWGEGNGCSYST